MQTVRRPFLAQVRHWGTTRPMGYACIMVELPRDKKMDKKEINSPGLTANFLFWICGGVVLIAILIARFVFHVL